MFRSLVRWFAGESTRSQPRGTRFVPQMEALGVRAAPGGLAGGVVAGGGTAAVTVQRQAGEEIPQTAANGIWVGSPTAHGEVPTVAGGNAGAGGGDVRL